MIYFKCTGQEITVERCDVIAEKFINTNVVKFSFCERWSGMVKTAQFTQRRDDEFVTYNVLIDELTGSAAMPNEIVAGDLMVSAFGYDPDTGMRITSTISVIKVMPSGFVGEGETPIPPTPDLYAQLIARIGDTEGLTARVETLEANASKPTRANVAQNLLDNSDFRNPINQRGEMSYGGTAKASIDRWVMATKTTTVTLIDGGIELSCPNDEKGYLIQYLNGTDRSYYGKTYTFAVATTGGNVYAATATFPTETPTSKEQIGYKAISNGASIRIYTRANNSAPYVQVNSGNSSYPLRLAWAAFYEGEYAVETLPPYMHKGYAAELLECQRYFYDTGDVLAAAMDASNLYTPDVRYPVCMRLSKPTVTISNPATGTTGAIGQAGASGGFEDFTGFTQTATDRALTIASGGKLTPGKMYKFRAAISADL